MSEHAFTRIADIENYIFGCRDQAIVTLESVETKVRYTYRFRRKNTSFFFVDLLTGPDNTLDFSFVGSCALSLHNVASFKFSEKFSPIDAAAQPIAGLRWLLNKINAQSDMDPEIALVYYSGICSNCNRTLTVPESIERGMGPKCYAKAQALLG